MAEPRDPPTDGAGADSAGESWLGRVWAGLPRYLWVAIGVAVLLALIPRGARRAIESNTNNAEDWLPAAYSESADLRWFRRHYVGEAFVLVSWDGCTLGDTQKLELLERKLAAERDAEGWSWYPRIRTGPGTIESLTGGEAALERATAIARLEGALVGPEQVGPDGQPLGDASRTTCLIAYLHDRLTEDNRSMRRGVERLREIAVEECAVPASAIHLGGPPVDNVTIDIEGEKTLVRLAGLAGLVGVTLAYLCFRSLQLTMAVFFTAVVGAGMSLAVVFYYGVIEVFALGLDSPRIGKADAILMSMPAVVYVLGLSGAIHLVNYYRDERLSRGLWGAAEGAVRVAWGPCVLAAFTTAVGLGSLAASDILPIRKFGVFTAAGVLIAVGLLFAMLPVLLHRFPPPDRVVKGRRREAAAGEWRWYEPLARFVTTRHGVAAALCLMLMATLAAGLPRIKTSVQLLDLLDDGCQLIADYTWLEENLGNLVPMEVIVAVDAAQMRAPDEVAVDPQAGGETPRYRMTMYERSQMVRQLQSAVESLPPVSRALTAATFTEDPAERGGSAALRRGLEYTAATELENARGRLAEYLVPERDAQNSATGRELWRVSARVTALGGIDYGRFVEELRAQVDPILDAHRQRDALVALLAERGVEFGEANVCLLTAAADADDARRPTPGGDADRLLTLLESSARGGGRLQAYALDRHFALDEEGRAKRVATLARYDAVVAVDAAVADRLTADAGDQVDLAVSVLGESPDSGEPVPAEQARAVYTGVVPVVYKTQRELLVSLRESIGWATVLIACVMVVVLRSPAAGVASMIPNVFPIVVVFGSLGWLGIAVDIGIMMTA
ncbi:MAG: MMPL family transporter, partial [Planctomycetota bacterium]